MDLQARKKKEMLFKKWIYRVIKHPWKSLSDAVVCYNSFTETVAKLSRLTILF